MKPRVVVVGGGIAGSRCCVELRKAGHEGPITLLGAERLLPYDRPPLSKAALHGPTDTTLPDDLAALGVRLALGRSATSLDPHAARIGTDDGHDVDFDVLVVATGATPIRLPGTGEQITLRTAGDAERLRAGLVAGARVTVVGSGWIGAEVATAASSRGCRVTCVEAADRPLEAVFGAVVAAELVWLWHGVDLRTGVGVRSVDPGGVTLSDGTHLESDVVVSGVGVRPCVDWLPGSGVALDRGVLVDERLRSSRDGVFAVGDAAVHWSPRRQQYSHALHWDDAAEAPAVLAAAVVDDGSTLHYDPVPYFWSDQFGHKLQYVGAHDPSDTLVVRRSAGAVLGAGWLGPGGDLTAYLALDRPRDALQARLAIAAGARPRPDRLADPSVALRSACGPIASARLS